MWCDGDISLFYGEAAVSSGGIHICVNISGIGRTDINDGSECTKRAFLSFNDRECAVCGRVKISPSLLNLLILKTRILLSGGHRKRASTSNFPLEMNARFERRIFNLFYKNLLCTRQHEAADLWPKAEYGPSVHRPLPMTCVDLLQLQLHRECA